MWDSAVAAANKAAAQAGQQAQVAGESIARVRCYGNSATKPLVMDFLLLRTEATKAKLHADILVIDRDVTSRKEKFGVELYGHLEAITSTQEFYVAVRSISLLARKLKTRLMKNQLFE